MAKIINKYVKFFMAFTLIVFLGTTNIEKVNAEEKLRVEFSTLSFETFDYKPNEVHIEKEINNGIEIASIIDNKTNKVLETISVEKQDKNLRSVDGPYVFVRDKFYDQASVRLSIHADVYASGSFFSINSISGTQLSIAPNTAKDYLGYYRASRYFIEDGYSSAYSATNKFPTSTINYTASGNLTIAIENTDGGSIGAQWIAGFNVEHSTTSTSYARRYFSFTGSIGCL